MNVPTQKAFIQLAESMLLAALIAGIASLSNALVGNGAINWNQTAINFGLAFVISLAHSVSTYFKALAVQQEKEQQSGQAQPPIDLSALSTVLDAFLSNLEQRLTVVMKSSSQPAQPQAVLPLGQVVPPTAQQLAVPVTITTTGTPPAQIDWSSTNPAFKAVNLVPPTQQ